MTASIPHTDDVLPAVPVLLAQSPVLLGAPRGLHHLVVLPGEPVDVKARDVHALGPEHLLQRLEQVGLGRLLHRQATDGREGAVVDAAAAQ